MFCISRGSQKKTVLFWNTFSSDKVMHNSKTSTYLQKILSQRYWAEAYWLTGCFWEKHIIPSFLTKRWTNYSFHFRWVCHELNAQAPHCPAGLTARFGNVCRNKEFHSLATPKSDSFIPHTFLSRTGAFFCKPRGNRPAKFVHVSLGWGILHPQAQPKFPLSL